jgi:SPOR domain
MADRYQDRAHPADEHGRGGDPHARSESDPLAELARLIGQTDPFGTMGRANQQAAPRANPPEQYSSEPDFEPPAGPPAWLQRANRQESSLRDSEPQDDYPSAVHPLQRYAAARAPVEPEYHEPEQYADTHEPDPSRYDDALYGSADNREQQYENDPGYADDPYAYRDDYEDRAEDQLQKRRGGIVTVAVVLALAVVGTGAAFAYRTYVGAPRSGEPPIIRADSSPTKIVPAPSDGIPKVPDRMASGDGVEKIVPREEAPVDLNARAGPRVVFPSLNQNGATSATSLAPTGSAIASASNGTLPNSEPRKVKTLTVRGDQPDGAALPVGTTPGSTAKQSPSRAAGTPPTTAPRTPPASANASANAPMSLVPQGSAPAADARTRVADVNPSGPVPAAPAATTTGGYLVQVSSQRNEADAQASYRALQGKFPAVLGSHPPLIKRADLGEKGVYYRAMVGPFGSPDEASQFCGSLKSAGGQCVVQRN